MDFSIIYIATNTKQAIRIRETLKRLNLSYPVIESLLDEAVAVSRQMVYQYHTKVIVSRGGTYDLLCKEMNIPVINMRQSIMDIYLSMEEALKITDRIAIVGFSKLCHAATHYQQVMQKSIGIVEVNKATDFDDAVSELKSRGIELVVGGFQTKTSARKHGLYYVASDADENAIELATIEALNMLRVENERLERFQTLQIILDNTIEGILRVDNQGKIQHINNSARRVLNYYEGATAATLIPDARTIEALENGIEIVNHIIEFNGVSIILNCIPIVVNDTKEGTVITIQKEEDVTLLDQKIRRKNAANGYVAKKTFANIVSKSSIMERLKEKAMQYARSDSTIAIYGETGTGKEFLAQSIHNYSPRSRNPFVAINCAALPESILESELFGYASGAFTGARKEGRAGIFELAHHGTVFLDEISELSMNVQAKFLRVIQEKEIARIGDDRIIPIDIRIIVASNKRLFDAVEAGTFRMDLYYRFCVLELDIPPLRQRREDIPLLIKSFFIERDIPGTNHFEQNAIDHLCSLNWKGNIRELYNVLERLHVTSGNKIITEQQVIDALGYATKNASSTKTKTKTPVKSELNNTPFKDMEIQLLNQALEITRGNRTKTAEMLSISTATLWRKMKKYGMT